MITINKNSWHYKKYSHCDGTYLRSTSLCSYFKVLAGALFLDILALAIMPFALLVGARPIFNPYTCSVNYTSYKGLPLVPRKVYLYPIHAVLAIFWYYILGFIICTNNPSIYGDLGVFTFVLFMLGLPFSLLNPSNPFESSEPKPKTEVEEDSRFFLLIKYFEAKKNKVCPLVEFKDD